jgi:hypothetical protein
MCGELTENQFRDILHRNLFQGMAWVICFGY